MTILESLFSKINIGLPLNLSIRFTAGLMVYLLSYCFKHIQKIKQRYLFSIAFSPILLFMMYGFESIHFFLVALIVYIILKIRPHFTPQIVFAFCMIYLTIYHLKIIKEYGSVHVLNMSGPLMFEVLKLISLGWNLDDGKKNKNDLLPHESELLIRELPSLTEYFSYVYYFGAISMGPIIYFKPYKEFITKKMFDGEVPVDGETLTNKDGIMEGLWCLLQSVFYLIAFLKLSSVYNFDLYSGSLLKSRSVFYKFWVLYILGFTYRTRYYGAFKFSEGHNIIAGFGFNGYNYDGSKRWDRFNGVYLRETEFSTCTRENMAYWNRLMHYWLKYNLYYRIFRNKDSKRKFIATVSVALMTCFWHGQRWCYYFSGAYSILINYFDTLCRKKMQSIFVKKDEELPFELELAGKVLCIIFFGIPLTNSISTTFSIYDTNTLFAFLKSTYFFILLYPILGLIFLYNFSPKYIHILKTQYLKSKYLKSKLD
ncbi:oysgedart [Anaeramoeba flamelloides]|uniref:Oysgedart n=1 Tax=Anaeramoeba flamelloides TaxID=1746091 RepID=A0ABQ8XZI9_9EUKA|nr:oysgedart [Anaeramoeba flamelloides]